jgi:hypothetical protein
VQNLTFEEITKSWNKLEELELDDIPQFVDKLGHEQPFVLTYLMTTGSDILNPKEREALLFTGLMIWHISTLKRLKIPEISSEMIDEKESKNIKMLEYLAGEPESDFMETVNHIMTKYPQAELLKFVIDKLMSDPEDDVEIREENIGMIVIYLKTIIDCLDVVLLH